MASRVIINDAALRSLLTGQDGPVVKYMYNLGRKIGNEAKRRCPVDEGRLRASIENTVTVTGALVITRVGTPVEYAIMVHNGTGIYGPSGKRITPKRATSARPTTTKPRPAALRWQKGGEIFFARSVAGTRANPFLTDALRAVLTPLGWPITYRRPAGGPGKGGG